VLSRQSTTSTDITFDRRIVKTVGDNKNQEPGCYCD
jgi:hypothetical protein